MYHHENMTTSSSDVAVHERGFVCKVYGWMTTALIITALTSMWVASSESLSKIILGSRGGFIGLLIVTFIVVMALSAFINKMSAATATAVFIGYSLLNGLLFSWIFMVYTHASIASVFFITGGTFGTMCVYGYFTKRDLTSIGNICFMALIGLIIASVVNIFLRNSALYWIVSYAGVVIFVGLTAYDAQKIKKMGQLEMDGESSRKAAIIGALALYLDFINLFLFLLRIFGGRK